MRTFDAGLGQVGEQHRHLADRNLVGAGGGLLAADVERQPVRVEPHVASAQHQHTGILHGGAELARQRPVGALVLHQDAAIDPGTRRVHRQLLQLLARIEGEQIYPALECVADCRCLLDGVAVADRLGARAGIQAASHLLEARRIEAGTEADQPLQHRAGRVGLHRVIDAGQRQGALKCAEIRFHTIHIEHQARRGRLLLSKETGDLGGHRTEPPLAGRPPEPGDGRELTKRSNEPATKADCQNA